MKPEIEVAINILAGKIVGDVKADDALKFTQAALNLAHLEAVLKGVKKTQPEVGVA